MKKENSRNDRPNIIYILADDMGYGDLSCLNENSQLNTVHFDQMARDGLTCTDAHSTSAVCTPSRYAILTGRYNWRSSLKKGVLRGDSETLIEPGRTTVASLLKAQDYRTAVVGKWHLGLDWAPAEGAGEEKHGSIKAIDYTKPIHNGPLAYGFDYFFGISASMDMPPFAYIENERVTEQPDRIEYFEWPGFARTGPVAPDFVHEEVLPTLTGKVLDLIDEWADDPFFIYFPLTAPHAPILPTGDFIGKSGTNQYGDFVLMCDDIIGQVTRKLQEKNIMQNTIVVFTSDNGCSPTADFAELAEFGHNPNYIFRGHKADIYEGGHRIPLIVKWPAAIKSGRVSDESVCLVDFIATVADLVSAELPDDAAEDSVSNLPLWLDEACSKPLREAIVHHSFDGAFSTRQGKWKLEMCPGSGGWSDPKPGEEPEGSPPIRLYALEMDIAERNNVYAQHPDVVRQLRDLLIRYIREGRSTPGQPQKNTGAEYWEQLHWMEETSMT